MYEFKYRAVDKLNHPVEGTVRARTATDVVTQLSGQGLQVSSVEAMTPPDPARPVKTRLSLDDLTLFNETLHSVVNSGLPLAPSLEVLARDVRSARLRSVVEALRADIEAGRSLSEAVARQPRAFTSVYVSMVRAGEESGNLASALEILSAQSERNIELRYRLQEAIAYPLLVVVFALAVMGYFSLRVVPSILMTDQIEGQYEMNHFTSTIVALSGEIGKNWLGILIVTVLFFGLAYLLLRSARRASAGRRFLSAIGLHIPIYGNLLRETATARFSRALGMLLTARVPVVDSVRLAAGAAGNAILEDRCLQAAEDVAAGRTLSNALEETRFFPETFAWLVRMGETRGDVDRVVMKLAEAHEHAAHRRARFIAATASPAFTIIAAAVVVMAMLAVYRPLIAAMF
ncbi:MAG: type II secretion system F family protein [FCB group bacterium]|jgi:type IV pilus assembly protein PilC|nr:type II secretion system F family protein [FCB group bacterium]